MKKTILGLLALTGLALTLLPSIFVFTGVISGETNRMLMALGMLIWFAVAPFRVRRTA